MWEVGELPGDDGRTVRDENGLTVATFSSVEDAREAVAGVALLPIARDMLAYERERFEGAPDTDLNVSGADLVDAFTAWREQLKAALAEVAPVDVLRDYVVAESAERRWDATAPDGSDLGGFNSRTEAVRACRAHAADSMAAAEAPSLKSILQAQRVSVRGEAAKIMGYTVISEPEGFEALTPVGETITGGATVVVDPDQGPTQFIAEADAWAACDAHALAWKAEGGQ